jgi:hypothetical protein
MVEFIAYRILVGKSEGKSRMTCLQTEDNIKLGHSEVGCRMWIGLVWPRIGTCGRLL